MARTQQNPTEIKKCKWIIKRLNTNQMTNYILKKRLQKLRNIKNK